jgi:mono/diheme cytochrome c family protein
MRTRNLPRLAIAAAAVGAVMLSLNAGCSATRSARRDDLVSGPLNLNNERLALGQRVFERYCNQCHPGGAAGLGPALNDKPFLIGPLIEFQVRHGVGAMPKFPRQKISDHELDVLVSYLKALRNNRPA